MSACTQCGTPARPTDKFCNACGTPIARGSSPAGPTVAPYATPPPPYAPPPVQAPYAQPATAPPPIGGFGGAPLPRCQMGHEIAPGASYCPQGHPFALDQMQFANDAYPPAGNFGGPPPPAYEPPPPLPPLPGGPQFGQPPLPGGPQFGQPPLPGGPQFGQPPPPPPPFAPPPGAAGTAYASMDTGREPPPPRALRGFLIAFGTNPSGDFWPLTGGRLVIGRLGAADRTDIGLQDPTISSRHAAMTIDAASGTVVVEDTGSTNGTFVNDEHIGFNGKRELRDGDRLRFGAFTTIVKVLGRV